MKLKIDDMVKVYNSVFKTESCCLYLQGKSKINTRYWLNCLTIYKR